MAKQNVNFIDKNSEDALLERYLRDISAYAPLTDERELELSERARGGDVSAREALVNANLKFVVSLARQYAAEGVSMLDLVNEGNIALLRAAERFDARRGLRFSQFAVWPVRKAMQAFCPDDSVRVKSGDMDNRQFGRQGATVDFDGLDEDELKAALAVLPARERLVLAACFGIGEEQLTMRETAERFGLTRERVRQIRKRALRRLHEMRALAGAEGSTK
ncbi:MAG: sigma-70 family RNA polymerase sigma factor [Prevotella sp.]|nr:sigma-70 family RNA polymerase sigma factor [Prevotella sp.]